MPESGGKAEKRRTKEKKEKNARIREKDGEKKNRKEKKEKNAIIRGCGGEKKEKKENNARIMG